MKVLETRKRAGYVYRRYDNGSATFEVPVSVIRAWGMKSFRTAVAAVLRGQASRSLAALRRRLVTRALRDGQPINQIAAEVGITPARVRQIRNEVNP